MIYNFGLSFAAGAIALIGNTTAVSGLSKANANAISILDRLHILDWISFAAGANANAISILDRLHILDWISFAAGANANAISILDRLYTRLDLICGRG